MWTLRRTGGIAGHNQTLIINNDGSAIYENKNGKYNFKINNNFINILKLISNQYKQLPMDKLSQGSDFMYYSFNDHQNPIYEYNDVSYVKLKSKVFSTLNNIMGIFNQI